MWIRLLESMPTLEIYQMGVLRTTFAVSLLYLWSRDLEADERQVQIVECLCDLGQRKAVFHCMEYEVTTFA